ncbi:MAG: DegT/DnrJ/EryC1/StrS family aminotransferase [Acidimicrobiales bacterium]
MNDRSVPAARVVFTPEDRRTILALIDESLASGSLTLGPHTAAFEEAFAARHASPFAIAVSSGTSALEIIFRSIGITGREVVVPTNTFYATAGAVIHAGGIPRLVDVAADSMALSAASVASALNERTAAVVVVHIGGTIDPEVGAIRSLCDAQGVILVEDAAHAHGSSHAGRAAGTFGHAAAFSFYPTKVVTSGEGGMILTADEGLRDDALVYRDQGKAGFLGGEHIKMGYAWRMSEVHAAIGRTHLARLDEAIEVRQRVAAAYTRRLRDLDHVTPLAVPADGISNYYKYIALLDPGIDRADLKASLRSDARVSLAGEVYARPLHRQPVLAELNAGPLPIADDVCARHICLPVHSDMADDEVDHVIDSLAAALDSPAAGQASTT